MIQLTVSRVILDTAVMKVRALCYSSSELIYGYKVYQFIKHHPKRHKVFIYLFTVSCNECFFAMYIDDNAREREFMDNILMHTCTVFY